MFLLFLIGLELNPRDLLSLLGRTSTVTLASSLVFAGLGAATATAFGYPPREALIVGGAMMFSSTIIGVKLLPTTVLHHQRTGEIVISILLLQDVIAIALLLVLKGGIGGQHPALDVARLVLAFPLLIGVTALVVKHALLPLIRAFDTIKEYIFLMTIGWCLGVAELAAAVGLSYEIGAFVAGVTLAASPVSWYIAESLKPLRDFFLVLFFFSLGAGFELRALGDVLLPAAVLAALMFGLKRPVFALLLRWVGEDRERSREVGVRLGQLSEFSLLLAVLALDRGEIGPQAAYLIQLATLFTFMVSTYAVVLRYPTPIALSDRLRRD
jgi:Kef-type K+ transport system membrane component KefB